MGLDVYLYRYDDYADTTRREQEYEAESERIWSQYPAKYELLSDSEKDDARSSCLAVAERLGLGEWGGDDNKKECIELPSVKYPEHMFKIGYFRSSYNSGGINSVLRAKGVMDLNDMFNPGGDYTFQPDWEKSLERVKEATDAFAKACDEMPYRATSESPYLLGTDTPNVTSEQQALEVFREHLKGKSSFDSYSDASGSYTMNNPWQVHALIRGKDCLGTPAVWVVYKSTENEWYKQALEIVVETCEWVIANPEREKFYLHWSG